METDGPIEPQSTVRKSDLIGDSGLRSCCRLLNVSAWRKLGSDRETDHYKPGWLFSFRSEKCRLTSNDFASMTSTLSKVACDSVVLPATYFIRGREVQAIM
jgi:hypothetical protein